MIVFCWVQFCLSVQASNRKKSPENTIKPTLIEFLSLLRTSSFMEVTTSIRTLTVYGHSVIVFLQKVAHYNDIVAKESRDMVTNRDSTSQTLCRCIRLPAKQTHRGQWCPDWLQMHQRLARTLPSNPSFCSIDKAALRRTQSYCRTNEDTQLMK